jgi:hypothetical protein
MALLATIGILIGVGLIIAGLMGAFFKYIEEDYYD